MYGWLINSLIVGVVEEDVCMKLTNARPSFKNKMNKKYVEKCSHGAI
jgi:hypothetical protein